MSKEKQSLLAACLANSIFGFSFMFSSLAFDIAEPFVLLAVRFSAAFLLLNLIVLTGKVPFSLKGKPVWLLLLMGIFQPILYFFCENYGILYTSTAFSGTMIALIPVVNLVLSSLILGEKATRLQIFCSFLSVFGVILTTAGGNEGGFSWIGFLLLAGAVLSACLYNISSKKASEHFNSLEKTYIQFGLGSVFYLVFMFVKAAGNWDLILTPLASGRFWIAILYLAGLSSVGAFLLLNFSVQYLPLAQTAILANLATVISIAAGILFLHEDFGLRQILGAAIILISVYGVTKPQKVSEDPAGPV